MIYNLWLATSSHKRLSHSIHRAVRSGAHVEQAVQRAVVVQAGDALHHDTVDVGKEAADTAVVEKELKKNDIVRSLFIRKHFGKDADHPSHFDMVINLSKIDLSTAENIIISALSAKYGLSEEQLKEKE